MSRKVSTAALVAIASMALFGGSIMNEGIMPMREPKDPNKGKMPLTDDEKAMLASLSGKDKKRYVKALKDKYYAPYKGVTVEAYLKEKQIFDQLTQELITIEKQMSETSDEQRQSELREAHKVVAEKHKSQRIKLFNMEGVLNG